MRSVHGILHAEENSECIQSIQVLQLVLYAGIGKGRGRHAGCLR